jgi:hypothetical protein
MNLQAITEGVIAAVNTPVLVSIQVSIGQGKDAAFNPIATYAPAVSVFVDLQAETYSDMVHADGLTIAGERWKMYITSEVDGLVRAENKGGDIVTVTDPTSPWNGYVFLTVLVTEHWQGWTSCLLTLQDGA